MNATTDLDRKASYASYASPVKGTVRIAYKKAILKATGLKNWSKKDSILGLLLEQILNLI